VGDVCGSFDIASPEQYFSFLLLHLVRASSGFSEYYG
jgi:hypothetical protein